MSFVMIATGTTSRSRVRTLPARPLLLVGALASLLLLAAGGAAGYWLAASPPQALPPLPVAVAQPAAAMPFALEQLGALSGRLFRLESEAAQLGKRLGVVPQKTEPAVGATKRADQGAGEAANEGTKQRTSEGTRDATKQGTDPGINEHASGGPLLPPRAALDDDIDALGTQMTRIEAQIALLSDASAQHDVDAMRMPTRLPIAGAWISSLFGNREDPIAHRLAFHAGLDFAAPKGTPIHAAAGGLVVFAGLRPDYGWMVEIEHGNGLHTRYGHASRLLVETGMVVTPGEPIAMVGSTGRSTGPHLHFEVLRNGEHVDPKRYLAGL